jgi:predicted nucleotidyltransferase
MAEPERSEVLAFLQAFNKFQVKYLVVGGYAVNHYGYNRTTSDIDIYVKDTVENRVAMIEALEKMGYGRMEELSKVPLLAGYCEVMMDDGMYIDLMSDIPGLDSSDFDAQFDRKTLTDVDGILIPFISFQDLLLNKEKTGRTKDKDDFEQLSKIKGDLSEP